MKNLAENNVIRFKNLSSKKEGIYANFKVKGLRNGVLFTASIAVDIAVLELSSTDSLEKIVKECSKHGLKEFQKSEIQLEPMEAQVTASEYLGVAQLG